MKYRKLGNTGLKVSLVGLGCNNFGRGCDIETTAKVVKAALDQGVNFYDTADVYGPAGLGEAFLAQTIAGLDRSQIIIASKFANPMGEGDLNRGASRRYIGHSNFSGWKISDAHWTARSQNLYNLLDRRLEREVIPACEQYGIGILCYFPLASGMLTGKYLRGEPAPQGTRLNAMGSRAAAAMSDANFDVVEKLTQFAEHRGKSLLDLAISWLATKPVVSSVIAGATSAQQVNAISKR
jgi:aryl-alcohol dehydrogenase-like predicted oxidoreductase